LRAGNHLTIDDGRREMMAHFNISPRLHLIRNIYMAYFESSTPSPNNPNGFIFARENAQDSNMAQNRRESLRNPIFGCDS